MRADSPGYLQDGVTAQMNLIFQFRTRRSMEFGDEVLATPSFHANANENL